VVLVVVVKVVVVVPLEVVLEHLHPASGLPTVGAVTMVVGLLQHIEQEEPRLQGSLLEAFTLFRL
jgi:hypothetical protein